MVGAVAQDRGPTSSAPANARTLHPPRSRAELLTGPIPVLSQRRDAWLELARRCEVDPTYHPDALLAFLDTVQPATRVTALNVVNGDRLIGTLPLMSERAAMVHVPVRRVRAPGLIDSPNRFDILCAAEDTDRVVQAMWDALAARDDWDVLELVDLPEGGPGWQLLDCARSAGFGVGYRVSRRTPFVSLNPAISLEENLAATSAKFRANVRRRRRNLEKRGPVELIRHTSYDDGVFTRFLELEHAGWKGKNGTSILSDPIETLYYRRLAQAYADEGILAMYALECAGEPVAMHFGTTTANRYAVPKLAYSETFHEFAPGQLLVWAVLDDLLARGFTEFDFLGDAKPWKEEWTDQLRVHYRAHIFNKTLAGRLARTVRYGIAPRGKALKRRLADNATTRSSRIGLQGREPH